MKKAMIVVALLTLVIVSPMPVRFSTPADAAPQCYSDAGDNYIDSLNAQGEKASDAGRHLAAMRIYERLGDYNQHCIEPGVAAFKQGATRAVVDTSSTMRQMFYTRAISAYLSAAKEAKAAGLRNERCRFARRVLDDEHRAYPDDGPDHEVAPLLRGC
jgi:hypothetical protein